ncbi:MAG: GBS Bsp-like repeat-containing protein [Schaedlerella sp.]|nr:GBS Bsp-like repeat-containing protein [Schaedlerella sp.]
MKELLRKIGKILEMLVMIIVPVLCVLLCLISDWMFETWPHLKMEELVYQLNAPVEGTNQDIYISFLEMCIPGTIVMLITVVLILIWVQKEKKYFHRAEIFMIVISCVCLIYKGYVAWERLDIYSYLSNRNVVSSFIDDNYVDASEVEITFPDEKRNLIYIFLESIETTYADIEDGGAFEEGCIQELVEIAQDNEDFSGDTKQINGGYSMPGTTWTIGGIFAQTAGIPLLLPIGSNNMDTQESFFPSITTVGDILEEAGYTQTFFIGSNAEFGGRELYFTEHGKYEMKDLMYAREIGLVPADYYVWWGYEDKYLFEGAKEELIALSQQEQPFNFTMLTVDTHYEDGYVCSDCGTEYGEDKYANVISCSSKKIKEFIEWIQQQDFYENTTIILCGDHPTMDRDFCEDVDQDYVRTTYTAYINSAVKVKNENMRREFSTFDHYPTTLASLGVQIEGERLGLGTNLFSDIPTLVEVYGSDVVIAEVQKESEFMRRLIAEIDTEDENLLIREGKMEAAKIEIDEYDCWSGYLPITVSDVREYKSANVIAVSVAIWKEEDQSDIVWIEAPQQEDGTYQINIDFSRFNYESGEYNLHTYAVLNTGIREVLDTRKEVIETWY